MPVDDLPIHDSVRHERPPAGCYDRPREPVLNAMSPYCRQLGRKAGNAWEELPECVGCTAKKDVEYIQRNRVKIDVEAARFMKADQRIA